MHGRVRLHSRRDGGEIGREQLAREILCRLKVLDVWENVRVAEVEPVAKRLELWCDVGGILGSRMPKRTCVARREVRDA
eukprot:7107482-Prymnesium_polylepis.1